MDDLAPFESPKLLIDGIRTSISQFDTACKAFIERCSYDVINYSDPNTGEKVRKLRFQQRIPGQLRVDAYRILNDLRNSLDQATCDGATELGRPNAKGIYFPFGKTPGDLDNEVKNRLKNVHPDLVIFIRAFNSHCGGDDELYALGNLAGPNKHQRILRVALGNTAIRIRRIPGVAFQAKDNVRIGGNKWSELRNELEIMRVGKTGTIKGDVDISPVLQIVIGTGAPPLAGPAASAFGQLVGKVERIVLGLEAETTRIKLAGVS